MIRNSWGSKSFEFNPSNFNIQIWYAFSSISFPRNRHIFPLNILNNKWKWCAFENTKLCRGKWLKPIVSTQHLMCVRAQRVCGLAETMLLTVRDGNQKLLKLLFNCFEITINEKLSVRGLAHHNLTQFQPTKMAFKFWENHSLKKWRTCITQPSAVTSNVDLVSW